MENIADLFFPPPLLKNGCFGWEKKNENVDQLLLFFPKERIFEFINYLYLSEKKKLFWKKKNSGWTKKQKNEKVWLIPSTSQYKNIHMFWKAAPAVYNNTH